MDQLSRTYCHHKVAVLGSLSPKQPQDTKFENRETFFGWNLAEVWNMSRGYNDIVKFLGVVVGGCRVFKPKVYIFSIVPCAPITIRYPGPLIYPKFWILVHATFIIFFCGENRTRQVVQLPETCNWQLWCDVEQRQPEIKKGVRAQFLRYPAVILFGCLPRRKLLETQQTPWVAVHQSLS